MGKWLHLFFSSVDVITRQCINFNGGSSDAKYVGQRWTRLKDNKKRTQVTAKNIYS